VKTRNPCSIQMSSASQDQLGWLCAMFGSFISEVHQKGCSRRSKT
jgi:hypothetical protein